uniref:Putative myofilin n=1 Tax=Aedes albopictus TaxID=7160 RepID=A0A023EH79_AEDAL
MFKNHLAMIGMNETPNKKARFWQSYIRSLKGSDDIRAHDGPTWRNRPILLLNELDTPAGRVQSPGYHYSPVHRETYGYSPRPIYDHQYPRHRRAASVGRLADAERAWADHLERMRDIDRRYPSRYGLYLRDKPSQVVLPQELEYEPDTKPLYSLH